MADVGNTRDPEDRNNQHRLSLSILFHALAQKSEVYQLTVAMRGLVISGSVVNEETWLEVYRKQDLALGDLVEKSLHLDKPPAGSNLNPRLIYLQERLRWGSGLTEVQMQELEDLERTTVKESEFFYLADVYLHSASGVFRLPTWRGKLDQVDGFAIFVAADPEARRDDPK